VTDSAFGGNLDAQPMTDAGIPIERLLAHRAWVRAVARALSRGDAAAADDLEQETWIAALDGPPRHDGSLRGWLGGVLRRRAAMQHRGRSRRDRRELAAARPEGGVRPTDDLVAEAESHARVAQAVVALPEPERTAILLRFFEGLPPRDVAARTGVPVETARSRIKRALVLLREELGGRDGSDDRVALLLAPLISTRGAVHVGARTAVTAAAAGGLAMGLATKFGVAALVLVGITAAWWTLRETPSSDVQTAAAPAPTNVSTALPAPASHPRTRAPAPSPATDTAQIDASSSKTTTRVVRWKILAGDVPTPATGSVLPVEADSRGGALPWGLKSVRVDGDDLIAEEIDSGIIRGFAVAPDGSRARLVALNADARGDDTKFLRERRIVVTLRETDGSPAAGVALALRDEGNNVIRSGVATDAAGRAEFAGLSPTQGRVLVFDGTSFVTRWLGTLDVRDHDVQVTWTLPASRDVTLRISVDGERRIPAGLRITSIVGISDLQDDESAATVRLRVRPPREGAACVLAISADGRGPTSCVIPAGHGPATVDVAIPRGATFVGRVLAPAGTPVRVNAIHGPRTRLNVVLEQHFETGMRWARIYPGAVFTTDGVEPDAGGMVRFTLLRLGTYRLRDETTGAISTEADLTEDGSESQPIVLDLSRAGVLRGRVEADDADVTGACVLVDGVADPVTGDANTRSVQVSAADGSFETWVPGGRALHLRVEHVLLRPDGARGAADVTGPTDGVVLRLVRGPTISFRVPGVVLSEQFRSLKVQFFRGEPSGTPAFTKNVVSNGDGYRFGGIDPGTWTLWIDVPERAPKILRDVVLADKSIDLGDVVPDAGLSLRVKIATFPDEAVPRIGVSVTRKDGPRFFRDAISRGESEVVVKGLVPGTYEVAVYPQNGTFSSDFMTSDVPPYMHRTVVVDASSPTTIDYSPR
jgi:RNA polymerase sigma factor (sigma-70 family)